MNPNRIVPLLIAAVLNVATLLGQQKLSREEYIRRYKGLAVEEMDIYGIPASIKMAQALLESDNGNGRLAREANNHFGIKCKSTWTGATISHDDDAAGECFRKYASVEDSYRDHSEFLDRSERYQDLFKLDPLDYKGWAYGLKQAGYATNPQYAELLIKIIEDNRLYLLDEGRDIDPQIMGNRPDKPRRYRTPRPPTSWISTIIPFRCRAAREATRFTRTTAASSSCSARAKRFRPLRANSD